jgi:hypothetical protein
MTTGFPKVKQSVFTCENGLNLVSSIVNNDFKWIFRPNHNETDFGIDAYIDIVSEENSITGQSVALQIKTGPSFFKSKSKNGFIFYGEMKHLNYYLNSQLPILIVICDVEKKRCYWVHFDGNKIEKTPTGWKINIPKSNLLERTKKQKILKLLPNPIDYREQLNSHWDLNSILIESGTILYTIDRLDIENKNIKPIRNFFERLQVNDNLFRTLQGRVEINIYGYDGDKRELFEIKMVKMWFKKAEKKIKPWFYFLNTRPPANGFKLFMACLCDAKISHDVHRLNAYEIVDQIVQGVQLPAMELSVNNELLGRFLKKNYLRLNEITEYLGMSIQENKEISEKIFNMLKLNVES